VTTINDRFRELKAWVWQSRGRVPHAYGYNAARWRSIEREIHARGSKYGWDGGGFDERVVEYAWLFDRLAGVSPPGPVLDAGSVMNHTRILRLWRDAGYPPLSIVTLAYEGLAQVSNLVRYEFADLRRLPYRDEWFSVTLSLSTLEHVGLDTAVYGAPSKPSEDPDVEVGLALGELRRVTRVSGRLLLSVPYGAPSNRGWFRVIGEESLSKIVAAPGWRDVRTRFSRAHREGWRECSESEAHSAGYNEPSNVSSRRTAPEWVAAAEAVALVEMTRAS
jgi:SAM-dependent methyltransferase